MSSRTITATTECKRVSGWAKLGWSALSAAIFFILASPLAFGLVNAISGHRLYPKGGKPGWLVLAINSAVFLIIVFLIMQPWKKTYTCPPPKDIVVR